MKRFFAPLAAFRASAVQRRFLNIHESDGKKLMIENGCDVQHGYVITSPDQVADVCKKIQAEWKCTNFICKSQVLAGGRGKGVFKDGFKGGVKFCKTMEDAVTNAGKMLNNRLVTNQTGPQGVLVKKCFIAECLDIERELYFAILLDRGMGGPVLLGSTQGGVEIEEVAKTNPDAIIKMPVKVAEGVSEAMATEFCQKLGFKDAGLKSATAIVRNLYGMAAKHDITQLEVNPLVECPNGRVACLDAKVNFDDSAEYRQKEIFKLRDDSESDPRDVEAAKYDLNYIGLDGNIACLVNGAGLAMATMDIIQLKGCKPANFLDIGGTAQKHQVVAAFRILQSDPRLKGILVNIFGGIVDCSMVASGIVEAAKEVGLKCPLVVRLSGTNADKGAEIVNNSGLGLHFAADMETAANMITSLVLKN